MTPGSRATVTAGQLVQMRELWEGALEVSATEIGRRFNVSKNVVIGQAHRRQWEPRRLGGPKPTTTIQRLDALNVAMDNLLEETRSHVEDRKKVVLAERELYGLEAA